MLQSPKDDLDEADQRWWLLDRGSLPLAAFRAATGSLLAIHFASLYRVGPALLSQGGLFDADAVVGTVPGLAPSWLEHALAAGTLRLMFVSAAFAACLVAVGWAPRILSLALFALAASTHRALFPVTHLDDLAACWLAFWLALLPPTAPCWHWLRPKLRARAQRVPALCVNLLLANLLLLSFTAPYWSRFCPEWPQERWVALALPALAGCLLLPGATIPRLAALAQAVLHLQLATETRLWLTHGVFVAATILFWGEDVGSPAHRTPRVISVHAAFAVAYLAILGVLGAGRLTGARALETAALGVLGDTGLSPIGSGAQFGDGELQIRAWGAREAPFLPLGADAAEARARLLLAYVEPQSDPTMEILRRSMLARFAHRYCVEHAAPGALAELALSREAARTLRLAQFECEAASTLPQLSWVQAPVDAR